MMSHHLTEKPAFNPIEITFKPYVNVMTKT